MIPEMPWTRALAGIASGIISLQRLSDSCIRFEWLKREVARLYPAKKFFQRPCCLCLFFRAIAVALRIRLEFIKVEYLVGIIRLDHDVDVQVDIGQRSAIESRRLIDVA